MRGILEKEVKRSDSAPESRVGLKGFVEELV